MLLIIVITMQCDPNSLGKELSTNNDRIVTFLQQLRSQRADLTLLIKKQEQEKEQLQMEMERTAYKIALIEKSLVQRLLTRDKYDQTIMEAEQFYDRIVESTGVLLGAVQQDVELLDGTMNKKVGTNEMQMELTAGAGRQMMADGSPDNNGQPTAGDVRVEGKCRAECPNKICK